MNAGRIGGEMVQKAIDKLSMDIDVDVRNFSVYLLVVNINTVYCSEVYARVFYRQEDAYNVMAQDVERQRGEFIKSGFSESELVTSISDEGATISNLHEDNYVFWEISETEIE